MKKFLKVFLVCLMFVFCGFTAVGCFGTSEGKSAYEIALKNGFDGTEIEWLESLKSEGKSAYELAVEEGFVGTQTEWLASLKGENGTNGTNGKDSEEAGLDGEDGKSAYDLAVELGYSGTVAEWLASLKGADGTNGKSAYDLAVEGGFNGTVVEWLASLKGTDGVDGEDLILDAAQLYATAKVQDNYVGTFTKFVVEELTPTINASQKIAINNSLLSIVKVFCAESSASTSGSAGSGVIYKLNEDGYSYIITNFHVVYKSGTVNETSIKSGTTNYPYIGISSYGCSSYIETTYVGGSMNYDIAVLKVATSDLLAISPDAKEVSLSDEVVIGDNCYAIGNPEGDGIAATSGIISKEVDYLEITSADNSRKVAFRVIRIDAPVNGGNSGGGLFNSNGDWIGVVNAKIVSTEIEGMAYAIPATIAKDVFDNIIKNVNAETGIGYVKKCAVGIQMEIVEDWPYYDESTGLTKVHNLISIKEITANSLASGKLEVGDAIISFTYDGITYNIERLHNLIDFGVNYEIGKTVVFRIIRGGVESNVSITFTEASLAIIL